MKNTLPYAIPKEEVKQDTDVILWSIKLETIRRFFHMRFWEQETVEAEFAKKIESDPRLESVADHSWHICDTILLIGRHFPDIDINKCIKLGILHDKMEILTGDLKPIGRDGTGKNTFADDKLKKSKKDLYEKEAIKDYLSKVPFSAREHQSKLLLEILDCTTIDAKFVKAIDKLQVLAFIYNKKRGDIDNKHLKFTLEYAKKAIQLYPKLEPYYDELSIRIIDQIARKRSQKRSDIKRIISEKQLNLFNF